MRVAGRVAGRPLLQARDELVEAQLLQPAADGVQLAGAELDEPAALLAEVERLAQAGLAGVQALDDLLEPRGGGLVALRGGAHAPSSGSSSPCRSARSTSPSPKKQPDVAERPRPAGRCVTIAARAVVDDRVAARDACARGRGRPARRRGCRARRAARAVLGRRPAAPTLRREHERARARRARASVDAPRRRGAGAQLAQPLVQRGRGGARRAGRARATARRGGGRGRRPRGARGPPAAAARRASACARLAADGSGTADSAACVGVEQLTAATSSISVRSVWWPTDAITGTRSSATVRHSVSSQNANRSASEPPPRATIDDLDLLDRREVLQRAGDARRGVAVLDRRERPDQRARPSRGGAARPATSSRALPPSPVTTPMQRGSAGRASAFWGSNRPSAPSARRSASSWASRSPSPAIRRPVTVEGERRRRGPRAGVVVRAAGDDDLAAVGEDDRGRSPSRSKSLRHIAHGTAPSPSRSSK